MTAAYVSIVKLTEEWPRSLAHGPRVNASSEQLRGVGVPRLDALGPAPRAELLHVLMLPDFERAARIGDFGAYPQSRSFAELLIDLEEDRTARALVIGMLRERERRE